MIIVIFAIVACLFTSGCIVVPIPTPEHNYCHTAWADDCYLFRTRGAITDNTLEFMHTGSISKDEILLKLGAPDSVWKNEKIFAYQWLMVHGYGIWAVGVFPAGGIGGSFAMFRGYVLLVEFDEKNIVTRHEIKTRDRALAPISADFIEKW